MNIWLLTSEYPPDFGGGIATYSHHTAEMLCQRGHSLTVFAADEGQSGGWQVLEYSKRLRVVRFAANQSPQSNALGEFARWSYDAAIVLSDYCLKEGKPDVLEVQEYLGLPYFILIRRLLPDEPLANLPVLVTAHTPLYLCHQFDQSQAYRFPGYWIGEMERYSMFAADGVVFPSKYLRNKIESGLPQVREHGRVIPNPFQLQEGSIYLRTSSQRRGFLFIAKLERRKGIVSLLSAFSHLWETGLDEPLFLVGDDWYDELTERWMSEVIRQRYGKHIKAGLLHWEGKQPPQFVTEKLSQVRAMVLPSLLENYPYAVMEAMAAGCPVVVSQSGGHAELVEPGKSGFVFSHEIPGDMENKIQSVLRLTPDEQGRMVTAAQVRVSQICSYEVIAPQKEEALLWAQERAQPRKYFPFLRGSKREYTPPADQALAGKAGMLSIVIPFFNLGKYLRATLESFTKLQHVPHEVIVIDDGSTDQNSIDMLQKLHERYRFRYERTDNRGLPATRNRGAQLAQGEFLAFLDADDRMNALFYRRAVNILQIYQNVSYVGCWVQYFGEAKGYWPTWNPEPPYVLVHNPINTGALVYRKADYIRYGRNDPIFAFFAEDYDSLLSLFENGCRGVVIPEPFQKYRVRGDSLSHTITDSNTIWVYQKLVHKHRNLYTDYIEDIMGLMNANGPGYLFDNPTLYYPPVGYKVEMDLSSNGRPHGADFTQASAGTHFYYAFRSILHKQYRKLRGKIPWLSRIVQALKDEYGEEGE
ncbi:MAG: hypothetical protein A2136_07510 [Chloroflexi bacterium RBG_16_54_11]|nr:MAG: hypothetical protein A2136_07510 [Chloroflexi bacterium RBG_16_54_11]